jgi:hypothetical protein
LVVPKGACGEASKEASGELQARVTHEIPDSKAEGGREGSTKRSCKRPQVTASSIKLPRLGSPFLASPQSTGQEAAATTSAPISGPGEVTFGCGLSLPADLNPSHNGASALIGGIARRETRDEHPTPFNPDSTETKLTKRRVLDYVPTRLPGMPSMFTYVHTISRPSRHAHAM